MFADAILCTHNGTGGSSTLTLAAITGYPQPTDSFGTSGTKLIDYAIAEYTDSTFATLSKYERGIGSLVLSTNVLTRTRVDVTWTSGGSYNMVNPSALTFGNTAANFQITLGGVAATQKRGLSSAFNVVSLPDIWQSFNTRCTYDSSGSTFTVTNGSRLYIPIEYIYSKPITQVAVDVTTSAAASNLRMGLYDTDTSTGGPLNLITEFTSAAQIATTGTGFKSVTMGTPFWTPPGFYWLCIQADNSTVALRRLSHFGAGLIGTQNGGGRDMLMFDKGATYGALPAVADTSASNAYTRSSGGQVVGLFQ
jgi:hypothetical protein